MGAKPRAPAPYVRHLFDQYAEGYDALMVGTLSYRAPAVLRALAALLGVAGERRLVVLDLGCGTGLSGAAFTDLASRLDGVDLSPGMIAMAKWRGLYDRLVCADLEEFLGRRGRRYDLILAADALVYLGDLATVFRRAAVRLKAGGLFLLTVEEKPFGDYALGRKRRYRHSAAYLRKAAAQAGLAVAGLMACVPRTDAGRPVKGLALALQRVKPWRARHKRL